MHNKNYSPSEMQKRTGTNLGTGKGPHQAQVAPPNKERAIRLARHPNREKGTKGYC